MRGWVITAHARRLEAAPIAVVTASHGPHPGEVRLDDGGVVALTALTGTPQVGDFIVHVPGWTGSTWMPAAAFNALAEPREGPFAVGALVASPRAPTPQPPSSREG